jgi:streptomycin 3"-adenylyltransferase
MSVPYKDISYGWEDCPESVRSTVNGILAYYRQVLGEDLTGFYLHGSLAMGCFNPKSSDIDFLAVVRRKLTVPEKKAIIDYLLSINDGSSPVAPEMSIVTEDSVKKMEYPTPFELHYSNSWWERYLSGEVDWNTQKYDEDLVMHYLAIRWRSICLYGKAIKEMFPEIPREICLASIISDLNWIIERIKTLPATYCILNPCRMLAFLREDKVLSKKEGGEWALANLPARFKDTISQALAIYTGAKDVDPPNPDTLRDFVEYASTEISGNGTSHTRSSGNE